MKENYAMTITYDVVYKDKTVHNSKNHACFSQMPCSQTFNNNKISKIIIYDLERKVTIEYREFYLKYLVDMLKLKKAVITDTSFEFQAFPCRRKTLLVCTLTRVLYEKFGGYSVDNVKDILIPLQTGKSKYRNKLKRFCDFYSRIPSNDNFKNFPSGHFFKPSLTKIKSTDDFVKAKTLTSVNEFFENQ